MKFAFGLLFAFVFFFSSILVIRGCPQTAPPINIEPERYCPEPDILDDEPCCPTELTGRYHLRGRTKRFFGRVS